MIDDNVLLFTTSLYNKLKKGERGKDLNSETFSKNLYKYRIQKKMTQREVADEIGVRQQTVAAWEANRSTPSPDIICQLARIFSVTTDELLLGEQLSADATWPLRHFNAPKLKNTLQDREDVFSEENIAGHVEVLGKYDTQYFAIEIIDHSAEPLLRKGDLVLLERTSEIEEGRFYAIVKENGVIVLRKVVKHQDGALLLPPNVEDVSCLYLEPSAIASQNVILGKVIHSIRNW